MSAEVKPGYKLTEVGVIPEDWSVVSMDAITTHIGDGLHGTPVYSPNGKYFFINGNNLNDGKIVITSDTKSVDHSEFIKHQKPISDRSILMSINGTIGNLGLFDSEQVLLGKSAAFLNVNPKISKRYVYQSLKTQIVKQQFFDGLTGSTIGNLGLSTIRRTKVPLPPTKAEQRAIAEALSDADALIASLEQLIAKKRQIKQGAMQDLLTGKKCLPGFSGEWDVKKLGDVVKISKGQLITEKNASLGDIPVIAGGKKPAYFHNKPNRTGKTITVSASGASAGYVAFFDEPIFASDCSTISEGDGYSIEFIYSQLQLKQDIIYKAQTGGAQPHIHAVDLMPIEIGVPTFSEQQAIAIILFDMDAEIDVLEGKLGKALQLKQGMMHNLLTGKIRVV